MNQLACIFTETMTYFSTYEPKPNAPHSAATQLIQGIYQEFPAQALHILRNKIFLNYSPTLLCRGMISIAAKRCEVNETLDVNQLRRNLPRKQVFYTPQEISTNLPSLTKESLYSWLHPTDITRTTSIPRFQSNRAVRAALLDNENHLLHAAENQNSTNKTLHAEVLLLQDYYRLHKQGFSKPVVLLTSLQCCKMCAAMIWTMHSDPWNQLQVQYLQPELGSGARDTILTARGNLRREFSRSHIEFSKQIETHIAIPN